MSRQNARCSVCGRPLKTRMSIAIGIGPTCGSKTLPKAYAVRRMEYEGQLRLPIKDYKSTAPDPVVTVRRVR